MIDHWIDGEQCRDLQSDAIDPFGSFDMLLHWFTPHATGLALGLRNAKARFVLRRLKAGFRRFEDTNFLGVQALTRAYGLDLRRDAGSQRH